jgi:hypothetical protein
VKPSTVSYRKTKKQTGGSYENMEITIKSLDTQKFTLSIDGSEYVEDLIKKVGNTIGQENLYRIIHARKLMKEGTLVSEYSLSSFLPVIVMVTQPEQQEADQDDIEDIIRDTKHGHAFRNKRIRTESEDSGFDTDEDISTNYVSEKEFDIALDIVMGCEFISSNPKQHLTKDEMVAIMNKDLSEDGDDVSNLKDIILDNVDKLLKRKPNKKQFSAFLVDVQSIFKVSRDIHNIEEGQKFETEIETDEIDWFADGKVEDLDASLPIQLNSYWHLNQR